MLTERFDGPDALITNEYARYNPNATNAVRSSTWVVTSGSLFRRGQAGSTGPLTAGTPNAQSSNATNSAVFRMVTARDTFENVHLSLRFRIDRQATSDIHEWDGIHLFLKYRDETELYYATVARRDGLVVIKRKVTGGPSNGGTYETLAQAAGPGVIRPGEWVSVEASLTETDKGISIAVAIDGSPVVETLDIGEHGKVLGGRGRIGVRGDNTEFSLDDLVVESSSAH